MEADHRQIVIFMHNINTYILYLYIELCYLPLSCDIICVTEKVRSILDELKQA